MKTPEEIKKGLEGCGGLDGDCENCPYDEQTIYCNDRLMRDALAYTQQLEDAVDKTTQLMQSATEVIKRNQEQLESTYSQVKKSLCGKENVSWIEVLEAVDQLKSRLAQVERERDAAVADLKDEGNCYYCKNRDLAAQCDFGSCIDCGNEECPCFRCDRMKNHFEWRGVCPENTKED